MCENTSKNLVKIAHIILQIMLKKVNIYVKNF